MRTKLFFTLVLIFAVATQTISAEQDMRELFERGPALMPFICSILNQIPNYGPMLANGLMCPASNSATPAPSMGSPTTMAPTMMPTTMMPATTMTPAMNAPTNQPFRSLNPLTCPLLGFLNSVPVVGSALVNSLNPALFGCDPSKFNAAMGK